MTCCSSLRRWFAGGVTLGIFAALLFVLAPEDETPDLTPAAQAQKAEVMGRAWPLFGGTLARNMVNTVEKNIPAEWALEVKDRKTGKVAKPAKNIKWAAALGSKSYGGPTIVNGKIYVGTNNEAPRDPKIKDDKGIMMCFRESDGQFLWQIVHDKLPSGQVNDWPKEGICSTPVVDGNFLFYVSNRCELICADTETGKIIWNLDMMKTLNVFPHNMAAGCPLVAGDVVFVVTANGVDENHINIPSPKAPSFVAVDKKSGKLLWQDNSPTIKAAQIAGVQDESFFNKSPIKQLMDRGDIIQHGQWSNPAFATIAGKPQIIFPGGNGWLYSFEPATGKIIWQFDCNPKDYKYELGGRGKRSDFIATPVVIGNQVIIGTGQDPEHYEGVGHLWCIDATKTGDVSKWVVTDAKTDPPKVKENPNSAVVWHYGGPTTPEDQAKLGRDYYYGRTMSTVAVHDGILYAGELAGYLHCLDFKTGKPHWVYDLKSAVWGSPYFVDNKVFIGTDDGEVWVFPHGAKQPEPKKMAMHKAVQMTPVAANGTLYILAQSHLYAVAPTK